MKPPSNLGAALRELRTYHNRKKHILKQAKKNKSIIYGGQAVRKQIGIAFSRYTMDIDVLSKKPKKSANTLQRTLDKKSGGDYYFSTPSKFHKGTFKVYHKGADLRRGTKDDIGVADYSKMRKVKTRMVDGIQYVKLSEVIKDKKKALKDKEFKFRWKKDKEDIRRIRASKRWGI